MIFDWKKGDFGWYLIRHQTNTTQIYYRSDSKHCEVATSRHLVIYFCHQMVIYLGCVFWSSLDTCFCIIDCETFIGNQHQDNWRICRSTEHKYFIKHQTLIQHKNWLMIHMQTSAMQSPISRGLVPQMTHLPTGVTSPPWLCPQVWNCVELRWLSPGDLTNFVQSC